MSTEYSDKAIRAFAQYFTPTENKYAILLQKRKYGVMAEKDECNLRNVLNIFINVFSNEFSENDLLKFYITIADYQKLYYDKLLNDIYSNISVELKRKIEKNLIDINKLGLTEERLIAFHSLLQKLDKTEQKLFENFSIDNREVDEIGMERVIETFDKFALTYGTYTKLVNVFQKQYEKDLTDIHIHSDVVIISEFIQFMTHYSYAMLAFETNKDDNENINNYIYENIKKAVSHLERAILDTYKIFVNILIENQMLNKEQKLKLLSVRQMEIDTISNSIIEKTKEYQSFVGKILEDKFSITDLVETEV